MRRERGDDGQFVKKATIDDVLAILVERREPLTGTEVGDELEISNRTALDKLNELHERGVIERKKVGGRAVVWWLDIALGTSHTSGDAESAADRLGGFGRFAGENGDAFAAAIERSREEFARGYEERQDDLF